MIAYAAMCYVFYGLTVLGLSIAFLATVYEDICGKPSKVQRQDIRMCWYGIGSALIAPISVAALLLASPFALCYGMYRLVRPIKRSLVDAFGRSKDEALY